MRRKAAWLAGLAALVAGLLLPGPAGAADTQVTLDPSHGPAGQAFTVTYSYRGRHCPGGDATFMWNFTRVGTVPLDASCGATLAITPPAGDAAPGQHSVQVLTGNGLTWARYTIDAPPPSPSASSPFGAASPSPGPPSASSASPSRTPTRPRPPRTPSASPSVAPAPTSAPVATVTEGPCRPDAPADGSADALDGAVFPTPVAVRAIDPSRVRPLGVDLSGHPQIRLTVAALADPTPVTDAVGDGSPQPCLHLVLGPGDGYQWAAYAFRDVVLTGYQRAPAAATATLSFSYGGVAWRYAKPGGDIVSGDTTAPALPVSSVALGGWLLPGTGMVLVAAGGGVWWWLRRTRHVGSRRA